MNTEFKRMLSSILPPGTRLGKYEVLATLPPAAWVAFTRLSTLNCAVPSHSRCCADLADNEADLERFRREAPGARLSHKHIVTLFGYEYDRDLNLHFLTMEYVDGIDLSQHIAKKGRLAPEDVRRILIQASEALAHAFTHGVVHRDIKPSNFLLARTSKKVVVKLTDLGLRWCKARTIFV